MLNRQKYHILQTNINAYRWMLDADKIINDKTSLYHKIYIVIPKLVFRNEYLIRGCQHLKQQFYENI
jgi:hypothetical protein